MIRYKLLIFILGVIFISNGCTSDNDNGSLDMTINIQYNESPLVMFQDYTFPDGRTINFSRFSMYISDLSLDDELISDVSFHNFTDSHVDLTGAENGYTWTIDEIEAGTYNSVKLGVGVNSKNNAMDPGSFDSGHPLAKPGEHWVGWSSYIFLKLEANMDSNNDGIKDLPIALHLGADDAYRLLSLDKSVIISEDETSTLNLTFDIYNFLGGLENTYDIDSNPQIHSLDQEDSVSELSNNITNSFN